MKRRILAIVCVLWGLGGCTGPTRPLPWGHAHNDYAHARPLADALAEGFCSIEADIFLEDGQLLVGHTRRELRPERTLEALYLEPLARRVRNNGGRVYRDGPSVILLVDIKSEAEATYAALSELLGRYEWMLTRFEGGSVHEGAITAVISGNRPVQTMRGQVRRLAACDGRLEDLENPPPVALVPLVSSNWRQSFTWSGNGPFSPAEKAKLEQLAEKAHANGQRIRFWSAPDTPAGWAVLREAGVDLISTDDLKGLRRFADCSGG